MEKRIKLKYKLKQKSNQLKQTIFRCITFLLIFSTSSLFAEGLKNPGFEDGTVDGWTFSGASHKIIQFPLNGKKRERKESQPFGNKYNGLKNSYYLYLSGNKQPSASTVSTMKIEAGKKYTVSIYCKALTKPSRSFTLSVFYLDDDGTKHPLGLDGALEREGAVFQRTVSFCAEEGMPFIGKRISLTMCCSRKGFNIDNAEIKVEPNTKTEIETIVQELPLVPLLDGSGLPNFTMRGYKDFKYTQGVDDLQPLKNTGVPLPGLSKLNSYNKDYTFYDHNKKLILNDGESASLSVCMSDTLAYAGFALNNDIFILSGDPSGMNPFITPDYMAHIAKIQGARLKDEKIIISRAGKKITWYACGRKGSYELSSLSSSPKLNLFARRTTILSQLRKGILSNKSKALLEAYIVAPKSPFGRPNLPFPDYWGPDSKLVQETLITDLNVPLSDKELTVMKDFVATYPAHGIGIFERSLAALPGKYLPSKVFLITRSKKVLDEMIRMADRAILSRNGHTANGEQYGALIYRNEDGTINIRHKRDPAVPVSIGGDKNRHLNTFTIASIKLLDSEEDTEYWGFNEKHEYISKSVSTSSQRQNTRAIIPAMTAYCISLHPEIWDKKAPADHLKLGETYRERAETYIKGLAAVYHDFGNTAMHWYEPKHLYETFGEPKSEEYHPRHAINRFSSTLSCSGFAANAAETFGDTESMKAIDAFARKGLSSWFNCYHYYAPGHNDKYLNEPEKWYRTFTYTSQNANKDDRTYLGLGWPRSEDRGHVNFTLNGMQILHDSKRYEDIMTPKAMTELARTFNEVILPEVGKWSVLPRDRKCKEFTVNTGFGFQCSAMLMFADYNEEYKKKIIKTLQVVQSRGRHPVINLLNLALMRAEKFKQIPKKIVE